MSPGLQPRRVRPEGVRALEVWNRPLTHGRLFWEAVGVPRLEALRESGEPRPGSALGRSLRDALIELQRAESFDAAFLGGGLLLEPGLVEALGPLPFPLHVSPDPEFVGAPGGASLLPGGEGDVVVLDLGQTSVKARAGVRSAVVPRDLEALPRLFIDPTRRPTPSARRREAVAVMLRDACERVVGSAPLLAVVLALPSPIDEGLRPGACTYGWEDDDGLVPAIVRALAGVLPVGDGPKREIPLLLLNDAELAAESARALLAPRPGTRTLVLTLGFGPGAALLDA